MNKKEILKYIFSVVILLCAFSYSYGQDEDLYAPEKVKEPLQFKGVRVGVNVGRLSDYIFKPERVSYEGSVDFNLSDKYFGVIDLGYSEINIQEKNYTYLSDGFFVKAGFEYNMLKKYPTDFLGLGVKLGRADFSHQAKNVIIGTNNWGDYITDIAPKDYVAYWLEVSLGVKGEIFPNIYLGWSGLMRFRSTDNNDMNFLQYDIPGFGNPEKAINLGATYYIYYQIPFNKN